MLYDFRVLSRRYKLTLKNKTHGAVQSELLLEQTGRSKSDRL